MTIARSLRSAVTASVSPETGKLRVLDLFSGIGGFSLGLERTGGFETVAFCEIEEFPRRILAKHWPDVPIHRDVRELKGSDVGAVDVICGGFPCQDISFAGKGAGIEGERSGLWREYARLIGEIRPHYVIVENVGALLGRGLHVVLGDLAAVGYDAVWHCIPASAVGAPHRRDRVWIIAYTRGEQHEVEGAEVWREITERLHEALADPKGQRRTEARKHSERSSERPAGGGPTLAHATSGGRATDGRTSGESRHADFSGAAVSDAVRSGPQRSGRTVNARNPETQGDWEVDRAFDDRGWPVEPDVGRVAYGVPFGVERLTSLGNAVVSQIPEAIGYAILKAARHI